jgi:SAM-dependent methyltransferase
MIIRDQIVYFGTMLFHQEKLFGEGPAQWGAVLVRFLPESQVCTEEGKMKSLYDFPEIYDLVLERDEGVVEREVDVIVALLARQGIETGRVLELACGACAHGIELSRRGWAVVGVDRAPAMLAAAQRRAAAAGVEVETVEADVVDFDLGTADFEAAIFMFETFPLLTAWDDIAHHFDAVRRHLKPGGTYIVDVDATRHGIRSGSGEWGRRILALPHGEVETWCEDMPGDWVAGTNHMALCCRLTLEGQVHETRDEWAIRAWSPWDLALLARALDGWRLDGFYDWQTLDTDIAEVEHYLAVFIVR